MIQHRDAGSLLAAVGLMALVGSLGGGALYAAITESMHKNLRGAGVGVIYAASVAVFGGTTQPVIAWLTHVTGDPLAPAWYMQAASVVGLIASILIYESAPSRQVQAA
jgi:hypothetical protein